MLAVLVVGCAGRVRPTGPMDRPPGKAVDVPAGMRGETGRRAAPAAPSVARAPAPAPVERSDLEAVPLPQGVRPSDFDIALAYNRRVEYWFEYYQRYRGTFSSWLERMGRYEPFIRRQLTSAGLPGDLIYLSLIESGFATGATSSASAVGIWQFMAGTARMEGMEISTYIDERRDPIRATEAAVHHLKSLYQELGSWYLVAAAYNSGSGRVGRALDSVAGGARAADSLFWQIEPVLPAETRDYVPRFLAASILAKYPRRFGVAPLDTVRPLDFETVRIDEATDLAAIARAAGTWQDAIPLLNPQFVLGVTPPGRTVEVRVPAGHAEHLLERLAAMSPRERVHDLHYTVRGEETPEAVAERYQVDVAALRLANHLKKKTHVLADGRELIIPLVPLPVLAEEERAVERERVAAADVADSAGTQPADRRPQEADRPDRADAASAADTTSSGETHPEAVARDDTVASHTRVVTYEVRHGDTVWSIAQKYGVSVAQLREWNGLAPGAMLFSGERLQVHAGR